MPAWLFALLLALAAVLLILALVWLGFYLLKRHRRRQPRTTRFIRGDIGVAQLEDKVRKEGRSLSRSTSMTSAAARGTEANRSRFYIFAGLFSVLFGGLLVKLWSLQIFQGSYYAGKAAANMAETVNLPAARGRILDRNKKVLATNSSMTVLTASKTLASDSGVIHRLSLVLGIPRAEIKKNLLDDTTGQGASRVFAEDISVRQVAFIKEHPTLFSGVNVDVRAVRHYPHASLACHILGYTGSPTAADLKATDANGNLLHQATDVVGKDGIELQYESLLSGTNGYQKYVVSSDGESVQLADQVDPVNGNDICLTIDIELQERTDQILKTLIKTTRQGFYKHADAGALICIDVEDGGILAMSSYPTYKPQELS
ncbi:MAG: hypothetical protein LBL67_03085, partial [Coriobacteriales bacterium]|nr:hypothetical protein [Coriobacteriales bacterium]